MFKIRKKVLTTEPAKDPYEKHLHATGEQFELLYTSGNDLTFIALTVTDILSAQNGRKINHEIFMHEKDTRTSTRTLTKALNIKDHYFHPIDRPHPLDLNPRTIPTHPDDLVQIYRAWTLMHKIYTHVITACPNPGTTMDEMINHLKKSAAYKWDGEQSGVDLTARYFIKNSYNSST